MDGPDTNTGAGKPATLADCLLTPRDLRLHLGNAITKLGKIEAANGIDASEVFNHLKAVHDHLYAKEKLPTVAQKGGA